MPACPFTSAFVEWDDPHGFAIFLESADASTGESTRFVFNADKTTTMGRLCWAASAYAAQDFDGVPVNRFIWDKEAPAKRIAKAINKEIARIARINRGESPASDQSINLAIQTHQLTSRKGRR